VARFVERELRAYLACGVLAHGFLRVHCDECSHDRLVAFSCKGRGFCPSCGGRRMADTAAHLVDRVLPEVPIRQWVLTLPYPLRYRCAWDACLTSAVLRSFLRALFAELRRRARRQHGVRRGHCGSVTFLQRFGSALNCTPHFHSLVLDGVYAGPSHTPGPFLPLPPPGTEDVARVMAGTARRIARMLERRGLDEDAHDPVAADDPLLAALTAASIRSRRATGPEAGRPWRRLGDRVEPGDEREPGADTPPRCVREGGMSVHADVAVPARDRRRLERLCRYVARPPLAVDRLEATPHGRLAYRLKTRWRDGTTHVLMERHELLERLAPLVAPPRAHQVRYHGVLAPCAGGRDRVVPGGAREPRADRLSSPPAGTRAAARDGDAGAAGSANKAPQEEGPAGAPPASPGERPTASELAATDGPRWRRHSWAELLQRVFEVDALRCPHCGARMRLLAAIPSPDAARRIIEALALPARAPPVAVAGDFERAAAPRLESWLADDPGDFAFDQSLPPDWDEGA
jgi:hypothetical protein